MPALAREMLGLLAGQLEVLNAKLKTIEARLMAWHRQDQTSQCLATIPGIGPIGGVSFALKSLPPRRRGCRIRRAFARAGTLRPGSASRRARTPRQASTGPARSAARVTRACAGCSCSGQPRSSSRLSPAAPRRGSWDCWRASRRSSRRWRWPTKPAPAQAGDGPYHLGHDGERRNLSPAPTGLSRSPPYPPGACKERSEMAIGRSEDRNSPGNPMTLQRHCPVWDPIRVTHLGQRSIRPHIKAGHMTATDQTRSSRKILATRGPSTHGFPLARE